VARVAPLRRMQLGDGGLRWLMAWVAATAVAALVGWGLGTPRAVGLESQLGLTDLELQHYGVLVLHPDDCTSAWRFLHLLARPSVRANLPIASVFLTGKPETPDWRRGLPAAFSDVPALPLPKAASRSLGPLGLTGTPTLLVFSNGQLVSIERSPASGPEFVRLGRKLDRGL